jgi:M6 family metalloprotease-like protein
VGTIPEFYDEISGGRVTLVGSTFDWVETPLNRFTVAAAQSGLGEGSRVGEYIVRILESLEAQSVDWGPFDNDGPDGIPNSGDDDGYVDVLAVMHPTPGAECGGSDQPYRIWSHRWDLWWNAQYYGDSWTPSVAQSILANDGFVTATPSATPGVDFIRVLDYTIQPVRACSGDRLNYIGVFAHELGHGFGLPDLYVTTSQQRHEGVGNWGLMGTGSWGCDGDSPWSPCHMTPWSKEMLGWADIQVLPPGSDLGTLSLPPVETSSQVYRVNSGDGSSEYLLLENRQRTGFDEHLYDTGLLVWHIDPVTIAEEPMGGINNDPNRMGVWLRQADGQNDLGSQDGGRGDSGDPFPGPSGNDDFHAGTSPSSWTHDGKAMGITLMDIQELGETVSFQALTRYQTLTLRTEGAPSGAGLISLDGVPSESAVWPANSAPFQHHVFKAETGEVVEAGVRVGFQGWEDGGPRVREHTTLLEDASFTAVYGGTEFLVSVTTNDPASGVVPGFISYSGGDGTGWVPQGESVSVTADPRTGFEFLDWTGPLQGLMNPATLSPTGPVEATAMFGVTFSTEENPSIVALTGGTPHTLTLSVDNANHPVYWSLVSGTLPGSMSLDPDGIIQGSPLNRGEFPVVLRVADAIGLQALLPLTLAVGDPEIPADALASSFLLTGPPLTVETRAYLDNEGNKNNAYDLGDFRAYVLRNPDLTSFGELQATVEALVHMGDLKNPPRKGGEGVEK